jgi:hypothetical protein
MIIEVAEIFVQGGPHKLGELSGVCSDIPPAKMILPKNIFGLCVLKHSGAGGS